MSLESEIQNLGLIFSLGVLFVFLPTIVPIFFRTLLFTARIFLKITDFFYGIFVQKK